MKKLFNLFVLFVVIVVMSYGCSKSGGSDNGGNDSGETTTKIYASYDGNYVFTTSSNLLQDRLFYFLTLLQSSKYSSIAELSSCASLRERYKTLMQTVIDNGAMTTAQRSEFLISEDEQIAIMNEFRSKANISFSSMITNDLRPCGYWQLYSQSEDSVFMRVLVRTVIEGVNTIINQYLVGVDPDYPEDGPNYDVTSTSYHQLIIDKLKSFSSSSTMFYYPIQTVLAILELNNRDEVVRYEPLATGENQKALSYLSSVNFDNYKYSIIIIPGDSPNSTGDAENLSESAKKHVQYGVEAFNEGLAPVMIISGANVYPYRTQYFEAIEMKQYMMDTYNIDEKYILIDPVARHTTTNLRNSARVIIRNANIPNDKKALITTSSSQNDVIESNDFSERCNDELGYMPGEIGTRLNIYRLEFTPDTLSLQQNPLDPLDN